MEERNINYKVTSPLLFKITHVIRDDKYECIRCVRNVC